MDSIKFRIVLQRYELCIMLLKSLLQVLDCPFFVPCSSGNFRDAQW